MSLNSAPSIDRTAVSPLMRGLTGHGTRTVPASSVAARPDVRRGTAARRGAAARTRRRMDERRAAQLLEAQAKRIAHALHDEAGQLLASVYLGVADIAAILPPDAQMLLADLRARLDRVDDEIRRLAHELRPAMLDDLGLLPACEFLAGGVAARAGLRIRVSGSTGGRLAPDVETALYRVTQEALANASRHARATVVAVTFARGAAGLRGSIRDNGRGFDASAVRARDGEPGLGLAGMRERIASIGGTLRIISSPGHGTSVEFDVPVERR